MDDLSNLQNLFKSILSQQTCDEHAPWLDMVDWDQTLRFSQEVDTYEVIDDSIELSSTVAEQAGNALTETPIALKKLFFPMHEWEATQLVCHHELSADNAEAVLRHAVKEIHLKWTQDLQQILYWGDSTSYQGLLNSNDESNTFYLGHLSNKTTDSSPFIQKANDFLRLTAERSHDSMTIPDTLLVSSNLSTILFQPMASSGTSVLNYFSNNNYYTAHTGRPLTIKVVQALNAVDHGLRMVAYTRHQDKIQMASTPLKFRDDLVQTANGVVIKGFGKIAGLELLDPTSVAYGLLNDPDDLSN